MASGCDEKGSMPWRGDSIGGRVRAAKESITSSAATSMIAPRARYRPTCATRLSRRPRRSVSLGAVWMVAMRLWPCLRIGTLMVYPPPQSLWSFSLSRASVARCPGVKTFRISSNIVTRAFPSLARACSS